MRGLLSAFLFGVSTQAFQDNGIVRLLQLSANATADIDLALVPAEGSTNVAENTTATQNNTYVPPEWKKEWLIPDGVDFPLEFEKKGEFWMKNIAKRYQWANWWGYCGEASLQIAAMYHPGKDCPPVSLRSSAGYMGLPSDHSRLED